MSKLSELLIKLGKAEFEKAAILEENFAGCEAANALLKDLKGTPHAFVLGCLMDRQIPAKRAWAIPYKISRLRGGFSMAKLRKCSLEQLTALFKNNGLHKLNAGMAKIFYLAVRDIDEKYGGDASQIWSGTPSSKDVVRRFREFHGVGPKISTMAANILVRQFRVLMSDYRAIDISVDVHIVRVMQRMGLVPVEADMQCSLNTITKKARKLNPEYPGIFDYACWKIGRDICRPENPDCARCPVLAECEQKI